MKFKKNIVTLAICFAMLSPLNFYASEAQEPDRLTTQQAALISDATSAVTVSVISAIEKAMNNTHPHKISLETAVALLKDLISNLAHGTVFEINGTKYIVNVSNKTVELIAENNDINDLNS